MDLVPCRLSHILVDEQSDKHVIFLLEENGSRRVPILIGALEATAIGRAVKGEQFSRPLTHDLLVNLIDATGCSLTSVRVTDLRDGTYYAELVLLSASNQELVIDCRPSDAVAILARLPGTPLRVADHVLEDAD